MISSVPWPHRLLLGDVDSIVDVFILIASGSAKVVPNRNWPGVVTIFKGNDQCTMRLVDWLLIRPMIFPSPLRMDSQLFSNITRLYGVEYFRPAVRAALVEIFDEYPAP